VASDEQVSLVDEDGAVVGVAPRSAVRRDNLLHAATAVLVRHPDRRIYVSRRSPDKDWSPSTFDAAAGGIVQHGEPVQESATTRCWGESDSTEKRHAMGWWERNVVPRMADKFLGGEWVHEQRGLVCQGMQGRVLEIGFGSGHNVRHYPAAVTEVAAVEPSDKGWAMAQPRIASGTVNVVRSGLDGQRLDEPDESYDAVLTTFSLCTIPDETAALAEAHRVLRPGGKLHFLEHGLSDDPAVQTWQHRLEPLQKRMAGGCHLTRQHAEAVTQAGFEMVSLNNVYEPGPAFSKPFGYCYRGIATRA
jgi:SAM-dependent methyltransferase